MVRIKEDENFVSDGNIDLEGWLQHLDAKHHYEDLTLIRHACVLAQLVGSSRVTETGESCLQQGLAIAEILTDLNMDQYTLAAAIVYPSTHYSDLTLEDITEQLGPKVSKLVSGVDQMAGISELSTISSHNTQQLDNIRKMLLAMVDDVRVVLIKLAERLQVLRTAMPLQEYAQKRIAEETMTIFAPLANRLGVGHIKWEMEDYSFRYIEPSKYKEIAKGLKSRRVERDRYVAKIVAIIEEQLAKVGIKDAVVYGRSKHIHSIYRKMQRKKVELNQIFDATAVRVLVQNEEDCYATLGIVHHLWKAIPEEFDDYISTPKDNGYRSLHTAVEGPEDRVFEVQIRTQAMDDEAELGVAAHWKYKEGIGKKASHERKISWLREVLSWQHEVTQDKDSPQGEVPAYLEDRIYVFTPNGDIVDLPVEATPLDFAYHIHTEVGHRCRGAKVNGKIVPLTYALQTGEQIEILTTKQGRPSRDWINPHLGYLKTSKAKAKILHWFKEQDYEKNRAEGETLLAAELKKFGLDQIERESLSKQLNFTTIDDLYAAIGRNDIGLTHVINAIQSRIKTEEAKTVLPAAKVKKKPPVTEGLSIEGVGQLLTHMAKCCKPVIGEAIVGYITLGRGISIHRQDCPNILSALDGDKKQRLLNVTWGEHRGETFLVDLAVEAYDRPGLLRDITLLFTHEKTNVVSFVTHTDRNENRAVMQITLEVDSLGTLSKVLDRLQHIPNVLLAKRVN